MVRVKDAKRFCRIANLYVFSPSLVTKENLDLLRILMGAHKQEDSPLTRAQRLSSVVKSRRDITRAVVMTAWVFVIMLILRPVFILDNSGSDRVNPRAVSILTVKIIFLWCSHI